MRSSGTFNDALYATSSSTGTMAAGTLYTYPDNFRANKILIAAQYSGAKINVDKSFKYGETNKTPAFLEKFPLGKVPAFETKDGLNLFESNAIAYYVSGSNKNLHGASEADAAEIVQWVNFADQEILPASCTWVYPCLGIMQMNKQNTERAKEEVKQILSLLNQRLATRTFLVGERVSLADIAVCCNLVQLYKMVLEPNFRKAYQNTNRWFVTMVNQPQVKAVLGEVKLCEKMAQFDAKKFQEQQGQKGGAKGDGKKQAKQEKPKQEPKKPAPKPAAAEEEEEPAPKPSRDPFAAMPKGTLNMDEWKKTYSNSDTLKVALPYFWKNFDKENFSIWYCEYQYPEDLKLTFMSCNLISGMFQRLDKMRKHAFASVCVFGEDNKSTISGVWFWRGHDLAFELSEDLQIDYESYSWKKLDYDSEETKKIVTEYFAWEGDFDGKTFNQGRIFK